MNKIEAEMLIKNLMNEHGLHSWQFDFDIAVRRFGCCNYSRKRITMSLQLVELNPLEVVKSTMLHEIAHALAGSEAGHGQVWREIAISIGDDGGRCYDETVITPPKKYIATCPNGHTVHRDKKMRISCSRCSGGRFNKRFLFKFKKLT